MKRDIQKTMASLLDDNAPLTDIRLPALSDLLREEQAVVSEAWARVPLDKRQRLLTVLDELATSDFRLDFTALFHIALNDPDVEVRRLAVNGLWMDENASVIRPLLQLLRTDESDAVRASAADRLGYWVLQGECEEIPAERGSEIVELLVETISDPRTSVLVRARSLESLGYSHDARVIALIEHDYRAPHAETRRSALKAMGRHGDDRWAATVRRELDSDDAGFRFEAARAAGEMADRRATPHLISLLQDSDREVREMAVWALGEVGGKAAESTLKWLAKGEDPILRKLARDALVELKMGDDADELSGLTLFGLDSDLELEEDEDGAVPLADAEEFRSFVLDSDWEDELTDEFDLDEEDDDEELEEWDDEEDELEDGWERADLDEEEDEAFLFEEDEEDEPDLSFLEEDEDDA